MGSITNEETDSEVETMEVEHGTGKTQVGAIITPGLFGSSLRIRPCNEHAIPVFWVCVRVLADRKYDISVYFIPDALSNTLNTGTFCGVI